MSELRNGRRRVERKFAGTSLADVDEEGVFSGYASVFGKVDLAKDAVAPGAFARSLRLRGAESVRMLFQHDPAQPIGRWLEIREDTHGLFVRGRLTPGVARSQEVCYDGAEVETLLVNWREPDQYAVLRAATVGTVTRQDGSFRVELESLAAALDRPRGRIYRKTCDAELGDGRCRFDLSATGFSASGAATAVRGADTVVAAGLGGFADGWFDNGMLTWIDGAAEGRVQRVSMHRRLGATAVLTLWDAVVAGAPGDAFTVVAGCDKRFATCGGKFGNTLNFQGFPHMPGNDAAYAYVRDGDEFDGGPLVP